MRDQHRDKRDLINEVTDLRKQVADLKQAAAARRRVEEQLELWHHLEPSWVASTARACGVSNGYDHPGRLGVDRRVALPPPRSLKSWPTACIASRARTTRWLSKWSTRCC